MKQAKTLNDRERLYRRSEAVEVLKERHGIDRSPRTLAKEHSLGTGIPVAAYDGRRPLHDDAVSQLSPLPPPSASISE